jgi:hypothetical protein
MLLAVHVAPHSDLRVAAEINSTEVSHITLILCALLLNDAKKGRPFRTFRGL